MSKLVVSILVLAAALTSTSAFADPIISHDVSAINGWFNWGTYSSWPYTNHRYAECWTSMNFADRLAHPVYLNAILRGSGTLTAYIDTSKMVQGLIEAADSFEYFHGAWGNWRARQPHGLLVGTCTLTGNNTLYSWNIESWYQSHYPNSENGFYIAFDVPDGSAVAYQVWLGRTPTVGFEEWSQPVHAEASALAAPNPSTGSTSIHYSVATGGPVTACVVDALGRKVRSLLDAAHQEPGSHELAWDRRDDSGRRLPSGVYAYTIETATGSIHGKLVLR